jgi:uncharacterized protein (TIGR02453 family)
MIRTETLSFLGRLAKNNNKPWFDKHRDDYAVAKEDHEQMITSVLAGLSTTDPVFKDQKAKDCIFRIFRDVRFSKDKTPYKAHFGAFFSIGGRKFPGAGYYLHLEPKKSFVGGGLWIPEPSLLKSVRQEIDYNYKEFKGIIDSKKFKKLFSEVQGERLAKMPQGYTADNPAIELLKMKSFTVSTNLTDADVTGKTAVKKTVEIFTVMKPFIDFLNHAMD